MNTKIQRHRFSIGFTSSLLGLGLWASLATLPVSSRAEDSKAATMSKPKLSLGFSIDKMDTAVSPRQDFYRFAAGKWVDATVIPPDKVRVSSLYQLNDEVVAKQVQAILEQSAVQSIKAPKNSPLQQVGDFYASGMDVKRLEALGVAPLKPLVDRLNAINSPQTLAKQLAQVPLSLLLTAAVGPDKEDSTVNIVYFSIGDLPLSQERYLSPDAAAIRAAYLNYIAANLEIAGSSPSEAATAAKKLLAMETRIASKSLTPLEKKDPTKTFKRISFAALQSLLPNVDLKTYFKELSLPIDKPLLAIDLRALAEINQMLKDYSIADIKLYLRWQLLYQTKDQLTPAFNKPELAFKRVINGEKYELPSRTEWVSGQVISLFGHPVSQLYVKAYFSPQAKQQVEDMIGRIRTRFRARLVANPWLSPATRQAALEKLDRTMIKVGYPDQWIDYTRVAIRRDDYFGNTLNTAQFFQQRMFAQLGKPVTRDEFSIPRVTLPLVVNAAFNQGVNGIEIPAAFLQPPNYDAKVDPAVNFCAMGAVIGHELTHGFDSLGRLFDAKGNLRNWWTDADVAKFNAQTDKLVKQADAYEVLPGLKINGKLTVTENLADVGGVSLAYEALQEYLNEHPQDRRTIDGYTPEQRCFLSWAQLWAIKIREGELRNQVATDSHSPDAYRTFAPLQHEAGFFKAFGIKPGDPMWLDEKDRVKIW
ncbi:M13 family metallopeptidase [Stenomitos frigidus]|uniref:M13 family peptidase n=1 Tax=Stenomitos frigidus ULC18 TaxID=2107698 RepID=A0A2T1DZY4_9CYAN|nr:M13 family metallopeptidase [Stenomitos frigidus]PSB26063.1 M13 family peptidase [Stenomitos frigidus ULC18]